MKTKKKQDPPSRKGRIWIIKKVIILLITMIISLSILLMPCLVSSRLCTPSEVSAKTLADNRNSYIETIINGRIQELKDEGYVDITYELSPIVQQVGVTSRVVPINLTGNLEEDMKQAVLKKYIFYANYTSLSENEETVYYFKTPQESDNFITEINKYDKTEFTKKTVKKIIGAETSQEILDNAIESKRIIAEKREAARRKEEEARRAAAQRQAQSSQIHDTSPVSDNAVVSYALQFRGNPYVYGGTSLTNGADCSGFVQSIYKHFGVSLPRTASAQASAGRYVSWGDLQPGDLVFYSGNGGKSVTHVAIYIGNSQIIHASTPSGGIKTSSVNIMTKMTARRVI
jgi:cell wall-associated NlpC family hydrolase